MIPQPIVRRSVSRAISAETPVEERASIRCLRHHGYASASQIVSIPASSIARADASISSSGSIVSCMTPMRNGDAISLGCPERLLHLPSSAVRTCCTCWFTIGCRTRWPIEPTGPRIFTSALHAIDVPPPSASESVNDVSMFIIAPTPLPLTASFANSGSRSSTFSMSTFIFRPPRPSGIFTFAVQCRSSWTSKLSTPGIVFAIDSGSFSTCQTVARGASNVALAGDVHALAPPAAAARRAGTGCGCRSRPAPVASWIAAQIAWMPGAAALAHALRAERRERRRALDRAGRERRHVERVRHVVVVEVGRQQVPVLVVLVGLVDAPRRAPAPSRPSPGPRRSAG